MGKILNGILGGVSGKVSGVVGANWKGINYLRGYAIPSNPQTPAQQAQRAKLSFLVLYGRLLLISLLQAFWDPFAVKMSGFNSWLSTNIKNITDDTDFEHILMSSGSLQQLTDVALVYTSGSGVVGFSASYSAGGSGLPTDNVALVILDKVNHMAYFRDGDTVADSPLEYTIPSGLTSANLEGYIFSYRGSGSDMEISNSVKVDFI
jgi:hypothetical protein